MQLSSAEILALKSLIRFWLISIKNGIFYRPDHQINVHSLHQFFLALQQWFRENDRLEIGFTTDAVYLQGEPLGFKDAQTRELAGYMHSRGVLSLSVDAAVSENELSRLLQILCSDSDVIEAGGGVSSSAASLDHIRIKEVDYSQLLTGEGDAIAPKMERIWSFLMQSDSFTDIRLPESKLDFFTGCFKDTHASALILNRIYKKALSKQCDDKMISSFRTVLHSIADTLAAQKRYTDSSQFKKNSLQIISQLPVELIQKLFVDFSISDTIVNLAGTLKNGVSDDIVLTFIETLITNEGSLNNNLLSIFSKLVSDTGEAKQLVPNLAERLFQQQWIKPQSLTKLQISVKELFRKHPQNSFLEEMYSITVDAVLNHTLDALQYVPKLQPLVQRFVWSACENNYLNESLDLLLNLLRHEKNPEEFRALAVRLVDKVPLFVGAGDVKALARIFGCLTVDISEFQKIDQQIMNYRQGALKSISNLNITGQLLALLPALPPEDISDFAFITKQSGPNVIELLLSGFVRQKNNSSRGTYLLVFRQLKDEITRRIIQDIVDCEPLLVRDYFYILRDVAPEKLEQAASLLVNHESELKTWEALAYIRPRGRQECGQLLKRLNREKKHGFRRRIAAALVRSGDSEVIRDLFSYIENNRRGRPLFKDLILLCGQLKCKQAFPYIERVITGHDRRLSGLYSENLTAAAKSLVQIHRPAAEDVIKTKIQSGAKHLSEGEIRFLKMLLTAELLHG